MGAGRQAGAGGAAPAGRRGPPPTTERQVVRSYNWISAMKTRFVGHGSVRPGLPGVRRRRHRAAWGAEREVLGVSEARFVASGESGGGAGRATEQDLSHKTRFRGRKREIPSQAAGAPEGGCESRVDLLGGVTVADGGRRCVHEGPGGRSSATGIPAPSGLASWAHILSDKPQLLSGVVGKSSLPEPPRPDARDASVFGSLVTEGYLPCPFPAPPHRSADDLGQRAPKSARGEPFGARQTAARAPRPRDRGPQGRVNRPS